MYKYSILPPSNAARRVACPGSRELEALYPRTEENDFAAEGRLAHEVASNIFPGRDMSKREDITQEMIDGAEFYRDCVYSCVPEADRTPLTLHIEQHVNIKSIHPEMWGTCDAWYYNPQTRDLHIWDYKFGFGMVEVYENWQLIAYAAGILDQLGVVGTQDMYISVNMHIVQPRCFQANTRLRSWKIPASKLRAYFNILRDKELAAMEPLAICTPNPECTYCSARHACAALQRSAYKTIDLAMMNTPHNLTPSETGNELRYLQNAADLLDARINGLKEQALSMLKRGDRVPWFKAEHSQGREVWGTSIAEVLEIGRIFDLDLSKPAEAITPKQAIKLGLPEEIVRTNSKVNQGALRLVKQDLFEASKAFRQEDK